MVELGKTALQVLKIYSSRMRYLILISIFILY